MKDESPVLLDDTRRVEKLVFEFSNPVGCKVSVTYAPNRILKPFRILGNRGGVLNEF